MNLNQIGSTYSHISLLLFIEVETDAFEWPSVRVRVIVGAVFECVRECLPVILCFAVC